MKVVLEYSELSEKHLRNTGSFSTNLCRTYVEKMQMNFLEQKTSYFASVAYTIFDI